MAPGVLAILAGLNMQGGAATHTDACARAQWEGFTRLVGRWPGVWQRMDADSSGTLFPEESFNVTTTFQQDPQDPDVVTQINYYQPGKQNSFDKGRVIDGWFAASYPSMSAADWMFPHYNSFRFMTSRHSYCGGMIALADAQGVAVFEMSLRKTETETEQDRRRAVFFYAAAAEPGTLELQQVIVISESHDGTWSNHSIAEPRRPIPAGTGFSLSREVQERSMHSLHCVTVPTTDFAVPAANYRLPEGEELWVPHRLDLLGDAEIGIAWRVSASEVRRNSMVYKKGRLDFLAHDVFRNLSRVAVMERPADAPGTEGMPAHLLLAAMMMSSLSACYIMRARFGKEEECECDDKAFGLLEA